ncbi:MAG: hypothetical protein JOZ19_02770 [Rubrobacter sp.]|nr:hypothetical protein [Rubrobacter sp.]
MSKRPLFNLSMNLCLLVLLLVSFTVSGYAVSERSSVSQEETIDASNGAAQPNVDAMQLLASLQTFSDDSFEGRKRVRRATEGAGLDSSDVREARSPNLR